jgi:hypothetical protein
MLQLHVPKTTRARCQAEQLMIPRHRDMLISCCKPTKCSNTRVPPTARSTNRDIVLRTCSIATVSAAVPVHLI